MKLRRESRESLRVNYWWVCNPQYTLLSLNSPSALQPQRKCDTNDNQHVHVLVPSRFSANLNKVSEEEVCQELERSWFVT